MHRFPTRHAPFYGLLALNVALWQAIAAWMRLEDLTLFTIDDPTRAMLAQAWARAPFLWTPDGYWPPLPFYYFGLWHLLVGRFHWVFWYLPAAALAVGVGTTLIGWAGLRLAQSGGADAPGPSQIVLAALAPLLIRDLWRVAATPLSEPPFVLLLGACVLQIARLGDERPPRRGGWGLLLLLLVALQMTRYEATPLALAAWTVARFVLHERGHSRSRLIKGILAGWCVLGLFPLVWMGLNFQLYGDPLRFLKTSEQWARQEGYLTNIPAWRRLELVIGWMNEQGVATLVLALAGVWLARRRCEAAPILALMLCAWAMNLAMALGNRVGTAGPSRLTLGFLWLCLPFAVLALARAWSGRRPARVLLLLALAGAIGFGLPQWIDARWGGPLFDESVNGQLKALGISARRDGYTIVLERPEQGELLNALRLYCGAENVTALDYFSAERPVQGRFLLLHRPNTAHDRRRVSGIADLKIAFYGAMPPPERTANQRRGPADP